MVQQSTLRPIRECRDCGMKARFIGPWFGRCPDCILEWQLRMAEE